MSKSYTVTPIEDPETGDMVITFPDELMAEVGWKEGDVISWEEQADGTFLLRRVTPDSL